MSPWLRFTPDRDTVAALGLAVASVAASVAAGATGDIGFFVFRDLVQVILVGLVVPVMIARPGEWAAAGVRFDRPLRYLAIGTLLGGLLYTKLFFVGVLFLSILRMARHWLVLFPLWWVGGLGDVLFRSAETAGVDWLGAAAGPKAALIAAVIGALFATGRLQR